MYLCVCVGVSRVRVLLAAALYVDIPHEHESLLHYAKLLEIMWS